MAHASKAIKLQRSTKGRTIAAAPTPYEKTEVEPSAHRIRSRSRALRHSCPARRDAQAPRVPTPAPRLFLMPPHVPVVATRPSPGPPAVAQPATLLRLAPEAADAFAVGHGYRPARPRSDPCARRTRCVLRSRTCVGARLHRRVIADAIPALVCCSSGAARAMRPGTPETGRPSFSSN